MTFEDLQRANATIKTMTISRFDKKKGVEISKEYAEVNQRIKAFRMVYPDGFIVTQMASNENGVCVFNASVGYYAADGTAYTLATGTAYEKETSSQINQTSYIENCETSAIGRALGIAGFGIDTSVASYEEVKQAMAQQEQNESKPEVKKPTEKKPTVEEVAQNPDAVMVDDLKVQVLTSALVKANIPMEKVFKLYKVNSLAELSVRKWKNCMDNIDKIKKIEV